MAQNGHKTAICQSVLNRNSLQLDEPQPAPLKFDENAMDWSYLKPTSLTKEMSDRHGDANWVEGQEGNTYATCLLISSTQH